MSPKNKAQNYIPSRRRFIQNSAVSALGLSQMGLLAQVVFDGIFQNAYAQANGFSKNYVYISQEGAPPRWYFDLPLTPDGNKEKFRTSKNIGTRYTGSSRYTDIEYATTLVNGLHMPWMWQFDMPRAGGGVVPMSNLMDGMLMMRGVDTDNPAHNSAQGLHYQPQGIPTSLTAITADKSQAPIAGINMDASQYIFKSKIGKSPTFLSGSNMISLLMEPFLKKNLSGYQSDQQKVANALESSLESLSKFASTQDPETDLIKKNMESAVELFNRNFSDLNNTYNNLYNKYRDLISRSLRPNSPLVGITDKPIGTEGTRDLRYRNLADFKTPMSMPDLRDIIASNTHMDVVAQRFAVTEFVLLNGLSSSISFNASGMRALGQSNGSADFHFFDEHNIGCMPSLIMNTHYNLAMASCLYELISQLKANNLYQDTVIDFCGEFGRNPQDEGTGSDHSAEANSNTLFSGAIGGKAHVIGNIVANGGGRQGTWGYGGVNPEFGLLNLGHFVSTLSHTLGVESQVVSAPSLLKLENGKLIPRLPTGTIVD